MTKEQAYERLELPIGADLQVVRQKFQQLHNDFQMRIDNAPTPKLKQAFERGLEELKEAYAVLNESQGMDDSASLPRTEKTFDSAGEEAKTQASQQQRTAKEQQQTPPPPPPRQEREQVQEQTPPIDTMPPAKSKSKAGLFIGIAAAVIVVLAAAYFLTNRTGSSDSSTATADLRQDSTAWEAALAGGNATSYAHYLKQYPKGIFMDAAIDSLTQLKGADYAATVVEEAKEQVPASTPSSATPSAETNTSPSPTEPVATTVTTLKDANALFNQAVSLGEKKRYKEAAALYKQAADLGDARAKYALGLYYKNGTGVSKNQSTSNSWYKQAHQELPTMANKGDATAQTYLGHTYYFGVGTSENNAEAMKWYRKAADQGSKSAQNNIGTIYRYGQGVTKDEAEATRWYLKAANQGDATAQNNLGNMYKDGKGVTKSEAEAVKWYRKAAAQGNTDAQASMGRAYHYGLGVDKDFQQAENFYTQAAKSGNKWSCERLADLGNDIEKETNDYCRAKELYQKSIDLCGDGFAYYRLGQLHYFAGRCGGGGYAEAKRLWLIGYEKKSSNCAVNIAYMYYGGFGVDKDYKEAERYFLSGIAWGHNNGFAEYWLGKIYEKGGNGIEVDANKSQEYFAVAKKKGYTGS